MFFHIPIDKIGSASGNEKLFHELIKLENCKPIWNPDMYAFKLNRIPLLDKYQTYAT